MVIFLGKKKPNIWQNKLRSNKIVNRPNAEISNQTPENVFPFLPIHRG
jgi:hypothetical protein